MPPLLLIRGRPFHRTKARRSRSPPRSGRASYQDRSAAIRMNRLDLIKEIGNMSEVSDAFLARAKESLAGAESEFGNERYNNVANRAYFACFHAAVAALALADI